MNLMGIFKKDYIVGLDIGSTSVKLAQFIKKENGLHLIKAGLEEISPPKDKTSREKEIIAAIKSLLRGIDIEKSKFIVSINCPMTSIKKVITPYMPEAELREGLSLEAKNYFPFPVDNAVLDFEILGDIIEKGIRKYEVAAAVSPKMTIDTHLALLEKAGIKPDSLIPCSYALQNLAGHLPSEKGKTQCFIDIGERYTELLVFSAKGGDKKLVFSRKIPVAGGDFTKAMTGTLVSDRGKTELSIEEAEKIKREIGIPIEDESKIIDNKISTIQILSMIRAPLEQLVNEIDRCFDYYREESGGGKIDSLLLFGGGASLKGLTGFLSEGLGIEVKLGNALEGLKIEPKAIRDRDKVSYRLGLAVGAALNEAKGINVLPPEIKEETKRTIKRATINATVTAVILISALVYTGMKIQLTNLQKRIDVAGMELSGLQPQLKEAEAHHLANMVFVDEPHWEDVFRELSNVTPDDIYLTDLNMNNKVIIMEGIVTSAYGEQLISDFVDTLRGGIFKEVRLVEIEELKRKVGNEFKLECRVD